MLHTGIDRTRRVALHQGGRSPSQQMQGVDDLRLTLRLARQPQAGLGQSAIGRYLGLQPRLTPYHLRRQLTGRGTLRQRRVYENQAQHRASGQAKDESHEVGTERGECPRAPGIRTAPSRKFEAK